MDVGHYYGFAAESYVGCAGYGSAAGDFVAAVLGEGAVLDGRELGDYEIVPGRVGLRENKDKIGKFDIFSSYEMPDTLTADVDPHVATQTRDYRIKFVTI
jgi:hypothetical protein